MTRKEVEPAHEPAITAWRSARSPDPSREDGTSSPSTARSSWRRSTSPRCPSLAAAERRVRLERVLGHIISREGPVLSSAERGPADPPRRRRGARARRPGTPPRRRLDHRDHGQRPGLDLRGDVPGASSSCRCASRPVEQLMQTIERIVSTVNRRVDESNPMVDARLPTGERVNVIIPPLALTGPTLTIRRFPRAYTLPELIGLGSLDEQMLMLLAAFVRARFNVIVSGGTGCGKTTLLNALSGLIPPHERIITIEDSAELQLQQEHVIRLESRPPNVEGKGQITIRDLVRNSPAHAPRPHHRRRGPRRRDPRHAPGHVDRPRRLARHRPRELRRGRPHAPADPRLHVRGADPLRGAQGPDQLRRRRRRPALPARRRLPQDHRDRPARLARPRTVPRSPPSPASCPARSARTASSAATSSTCRCRARSPRSCTSPTNRCRPPSASPEAIDALNTRQAIG